MGAVAESVSLEKDTESRAHETAGSQAGVASPGVSFDPFVDGMFQGPPGNPPGAAARSLSTTSLKAPVLQRAQRLYGNRASQQIVTRARVLQRTCACGGTCTKCQEDEEQRALQRSPATPSPSEFDGIPDTQGEPLDSASRQPLEKHFGANLAEVRVHSGKEDEESAARLGALAYTSGRHIYFAAGGYAPGSDSGRRLLAHEVAHVVQQSSGKEPTIATKSSRGVKIGAPDDMLENEAEREAEQFMSGPVTDEEERRKRELPGIVQPFIQRQEASPNVAAPPPQLGPVFGPPAPLPPGTYSIDVGYWTFSTDQKQLKEELFKVVGERGIGGAEDALWYTRMAHNPDLCNDPVEQSPECKAWVTSKYKVIEAMEPLVPVVHKEAQEVVDDFEKKMKVNVDNMLSENKKETKEEMARYGITTTEYETKGECFNDEFGRHCSLSYSHTDYGMQTQSTESLGLADAAKILLDRANAINEKKNEQSRHFDVYCDMDACFDVPDDDYSSFTPIIEAMEKDYAKIRRPLEEKYPVLAPFADKKDSPDGLATLANKDPSNADAKARLVGEKLKKTISDIEDVQEARRDDDLNVWRLDKIVEVTKLQNGTKDDPIRNKLVDQKFEDEKPSALTQILLLAINILGLVLAAPTGGISLVLTAGLNAAVAVVHVRDYLLQSALAGSGLGAAKALSQDTPSLFWLAVEIVGVGVDVGAAAGAVTKTFANLARLAKTADEAAKGSEEAADAIKALKEAASHEPNGEAIVAGIERHFQGASKEGEVLEAFGGTKQEAELFEASTKAAEEAGKAAESAVPTATTLAGGEVKATKAGLFSCHSPCTFLRERFTKELALREDLNQKLLDLEAELVAKQGDEAALQTIAERAAKIEDELRQTLTFKPARFGEPGFSDLLKRRGSGAEKLINKPQNWTGAEEASFKFGDKAVLDAEQAQKYYWRLDQEGELSLVRKDTEFPKLRFEPGEGKFVEVEDTVVRAQYAEDVVPKGTDKGVFSKAKLSAGERKEFDEIMKQRQTLMDERDTLQELDEAGKLTAEQEERLSKVRGLINRESEQLGNKAAERYMQSLHAKPVYASAPGESGVFDQVWKITEKLPDGKTVERFYVVEAKGGGSRLGTRITQGGVAAEQGTPQYFESILANMGSGELKTDLQLAYTEGRVTYLKVQAPIGTKAGKDVLSDFKVAQFNLSTSQ